MSLDERTHDLPADQACDDAQGCTVGGHLLDPGQDADGAHVSHAGVDPSPADQCAPDAQSTSVGGQPLDPGHGRPDAQSHLAGVDLLPADQTITDAHSSGVGGHPLDPGHHSRDTHALPAGVDLSPADQGDHDAQTSPVGGHPLDPGQRRVDAHIGSAGVDPSPADQRPLDAQAWSVGGHPLNPGQASGDAHGTSAEVDLLLILADALDDMESVRKATNNRISALTRTPDQHGKGLSPESKAAKTLVAIAAGIEALEHEATLALQRALRKHPLGPWIKAQKGVGEKQAARLLAAIGDPYWHERAGRPRTVSELWAFCGFHVLHLGQQRLGAQGDRAGVESSSDAGHATCGTHTLPAGVAPARRKGQQCNWNTAARSRAWLIAEACVKQLKAPCGRAEGDKWATHAEGCQCGPYRLVYDQARIKYAGVVHAADCYRCGTAGKAGMPLTDGHQHARALRIVAKTVLRDLWRESKRIHEATG